MAALGGCLLFVLLTVNFGVPAPRAALITIAGTIILRVPAIEFNWRTKPLSHPETPGEE